MGYLTTFTIFNDGIHLILEDSKDFCGKLYDAALSDGRITNISHGNHCNLVKVQKTRHADDTTLYVHMGNTLSEMSAYSKSAEELMRNNPESFTKMLRFMKTQVGDLEDMLKEYQAASKQE